MERIDTITLERILPRVFRGAEKDEPVASSHVWMTDLSLGRETDYLIEAESGTGKSSFCAFVYGSRRDYDGRIFFNGREVATFSIGDWCEVRRRHLAYLPQEMRLFPELTALANILIKNRLTDRYAESEIVRMMEFLEIDLKRNTPAARLSVGQQQRVAIIRALCQPFDFILLDEPVSHLDARNNLAAARLIADRAAASDSAVITTSVGNPLLLRELERKRDVISVKL